MPPTHPTPVRGTAHQHTIASHHTLDDFLGYENDALIARFRKDLGVDENEASELFSDMKRFLWLTSLYDEPIAPPPKIDSAWHTFIIFTEDYASFCTKYFGYFLHHRPRAPDDPSDGGVIMHRTIGAIEAHLRGFQSLSGNWSFPHLKEDGSCSSDSVSCAPTPSCNSN